MSLSVSDCDTAPACERVYNAGTTAAQSFWIGHKAQSTSQEPYILL